jgi:hypothetical protein
LTKAAGSGSSLDGPPTCELDEEGSASVGPYGSRQISPDGDISGRIEQGYRIWS